MNGKILIAFISLLLLLGGFVYFFYFPKKPASDEIVEIVTDLAPLDCDLNTNFSCFVTFKNKSITFSLSPKPVFAMQPVSMRIEGLSELNFKNPSLEIYGINMQMGTIKAKLERKGNEYVANIVLSACVISVMRYRFEIADDGKRTGLYIDFDLKQ